MEIFPTIDRIVSGLEDRSRDGSFLLGISGIDASGKGFASALIEEELRRRSIEVAVINVDDWLNLPNVRYADLDAAEHFYEHSHRLDEMFDRLILPLRQRRSIRLTADLAKETAAKYHTFEYIFDEVDLILIEGIFIFKKSYRDLFDLRIWVDCSFETALRRAIVRSQEGLDREATLKAYETIYFPAQLLHLVTDEPKLNADLTIDNN